MRRIIKKLVPTALAMSLRFRRRHHVWPNLLNPKTFNEKVLHRIVFDRRPLLTTMADKMAVRDYVASKLGEVVLPKLYEENDLPNKFVMKATHGSGYVKVIIDRSKINWTEVESIKQKWLSESYYEKTREWPYKNINPQIIYEEFIDDSSGEVPPDYKFFVFSGRVQMIQVDAGRFTDHRRRLYSRDWQKLPVLFEYQDIDGQVPKPVHLEEMIAAAEKLGEDIEFIRADFYDTPQKIYFGELTTTPECGAGRFNPVEFDLWLGNYWNLS